MSNLETGYVAIFRSIQDHWLWEEKPFSRGQAWIDLILQAAYTEVDVFVNGSKCSLKRGELITSFRELSKRWGWSHWKVDKFLKQLQSDCMITSQKSAKNGTLIKIENYSFYQGKKNDTGHQPDTNRTLTGHQPDTFYIDNQVNQVNQIYSRACSTTHTPISESGNVTEFQGSDTTTLEESKGSDTRKLGEPKGSEARTVEESENSDVAHPKETGIPYREIVEYLNEKTGKSYKPTTKETQSKIKARWKEGFRLKHFKKAIDNKVASWKGDPEFDQYLRPGTLFGPKFESYVNENPKLIKKREFHDLKKGIMRPQDEGWMERVLENSRKKSLRGDGK